MWVILYSVTMLPCLGWILQWWSTEQYHDMNMRQQHWWRPLPLQDSRVHRTTPICCLHRKTCSILDTPKRTGCLQQKSASVGFKDCLVKYNICMYKYETQELTGISLPRERGPLVSFLLPIQESVHILNVFFFFKGGWGYVTGWRRY